MSDLATHNHASPVGNAPPWPEIAKLKIGDVDCVSILADVGMKVHAYRHASKECEPKEKGGAPNPAYQQSDHIIQNACFVNERTDKKGISTCKDYYYKNAPCVCIKDATDPLTEHGRKTQAQNAWAVDQRAAGTNPTYKSAREANLDAMKKAKPEIADGADGKEHPAITCLRMVCDAYFLPMMDNNENTEVRTPADGEFTPTPTAFDVPV